MAVVDDIAYRPWRESNAEAGFRWRLGARPLDLASWFEFGADGDAWVAAKPALLAAHHDVVCAFVPGVDAECAEVAATIVEHLRTHHPERAGPDPTGHDPTCDGRIGGVGLDDGPAALVAAARLVPEDLVLMVERDGRMQFAGGVVCFPNRWDLRSKLGTSLTVTHGPVAQLNEQLAGPIDRFFARLTPQRSYWRLGWGVIDTVDGFAPPERSDVGRGQDTADEMYVRVERETIRRFPRTGAVLFTIRTHITSLATLAARSPGDVRMIAAAVASMPDDVAAYKGITPAVAGAITARAEALSAPARPTWP